MNSLPPGDYRDKLVDLFFEDFIQTEYSAVLDGRRCVRQVPLAMKISKGLIEFYQTPLGQKTLTVLPKLSVELQNGRHARGRAGGTRIND